MQGHALNRDLGGRIRHNHTQHTRSSAAVLHSNSSKFNNSSKTVWRSQAQPNDDNNTSSTSSSGDWRLSNLFNRSSTTSPAAATSTSNGRSPSPAAGGSAVLSSAEEVDQQLQQAAQFQLAFQEGRLGFGFSAGGLLFPYYLGVAQQLQELGILQDSTQLAGASAGSLIVACIKSGLPFDTIQEACFELARNCRDNGTRHRLRHVLEGTLREVLPADVADVCSGAIHVAITRVTPGLQPAMVSSFRDREDLIQALLTSCHIPWYFDGSLIRSFRAAPCFDGGITNFLPNVPGPSMTTCRICCLPRQQLAAIRNISISPDAFSPWPYNVQQMLNWALEPADEDMLAELIDFGRRDALLWAQQTGLAALAAGGSSSSSVVSSSSSSLSSLDGSPLASSDGVWLPRGGAAAAAAAGQEGGEQQAVGTSLIGLIRTLVTHSSNSSNSSSKK